MNDFIALYEIVLSLSGYTYIRETLQNKKAFKGRSTLFLNAFSLLIMILLLGVIFVVFLNIYRYFF